MSTSKRRKDTKVPSKLKNVISNLLDLMYRINYSDFYLGVASGSPPSTGSVAPVVGV